MQKGWQDPSIWDISNFTWCLTLLQHGAEELLHALMCRGLRASLAQASLERTWGCVLLYQTGHGTAVMPVCVMAQELLLIL